MQVIVTYELADLLRERVAARGLPVEVIEARRDGNLDRDPAQAEVFLRAFIPTDLYKRVLDQAPNLKWVHTGSAGVDGLLIDALRSRNIVLTNSAGVHAIPIAEWTIFALLLIAKRGREMLEAQAEKRWADDLPLDELGGKTLTILGAGGIGREIAKRAAAFDLRVWGVNRSGRSVEGVDRIFSGDKWRDALPDTDFLVIAAPLTEATRHIIGSRELDLLPDHAWLINVARGGLVDEAALIAALRGGVIGGAALDTFEQEPLRADSPLWALPNVLVWPHHSGASPHTKARQTDFFVDNLQRFLNGDELRNIVDFDAGY